jgi:23S rRNA (cytosine1962-C5)-methyltransferase
LKPGREKSLDRRHPWIFSGAVERVDGSPDDGETVQVIDAGGRFLAWAAYSVHSQIRARVWSWNSADEIGEDFFSTCLERSITARRESDYFKKTDALRLVHGESDGIPGLVVDNYGGYLAAQFLSSGSEYWREMLADLLMKMTGAACLYERSDVEVRQLEGLPQRVGLLRGNPPPTHITIRENGLSIRVDIQHGHKTGYYLDQRENRALVGQWAAGHHILDCFTYTGGFTLYALAGGAESVVSVDASADALALARENLLLNNLPAEKVTWQQADVFRFLRTLRDQARQFDMIILDPPKFAQTVSQVQQAARGYKDINLLAFKLLRPGGILATFSCSGGVSEELFQKIIAGAALDAGVEAQIIARLHQAGDHPVSLAFPEGAYLKGFLLHKMG